MTIMFVVPMTVMSMMALILYACWGLDICDDLDDCNAVLQSQNNFFLSYTAPAVAPTPSKSFGFLLLQLHNIAVISVVLVWP
jgi:hypothetical protein